MTVTKFSEGKRLNLDGTDTWSCMLELAFCRAGDGNIEKTHEEISGLLGIVLTSVERKFGERAAKKRAADYQQNNCEEGKRRRAKAVMSKAHRMGKENAKSERHINSKVPTVELAKTAAKTVKPRKPNRCGRCKQLGHTVRDGCPMLARSKRCKDAQLLEWRVDESSILKNCAKRPRRRKIEPVLLEW